MLVPEDDEELDQQGGYAVGRLLEDRRDWFTVCSPVHPE
jgi:hypothetical protein